MQLNREVILASMLSMVFVRCASVHGPPSEAEVERTLHTRQPWRTHASLRLGERLPSPEMSSASRELDYDGAALVALAHNASLRQARAARGIVRAQIIQARVLPNPRLAGALDIPTDGAVDGTNVGYAAGISWQINPLFAVRTAVDAERHEAQAVELGVAWSEWQVVENARLGVVRLTLLARRLELARGIADQWQSQEALLERAMSAHDATVLQVQAARSASEEAALAVLALVQEQRLVRLDWLAALGLPPGSDVRVAGDPHLPENEQSPHLVDLVRQLPETRLDLVGLLQTVEAQDGRARAATINAFPPVEISLGRTLDTTNVGSFGVGVSIDLPFFDRNQGAIQLARATLQQLRETYLVRLQQARFEVARALSEMSSVQQRLTVARQSVRHLEQLVTGAEQLVRGGAMSVIHVYELRRAWLERRLLSERLRQRQLELGVALELAVGAPWATEGGP